MSHSICCRLHHSTHGNHVTEVLQSCVCLVISAAVSVCLLWGFVTELNERCLMTLIELMRHCFKWSVASFAQTDGTEWLGWWFACTLASEGLPLNSEAWSHSLRILPICPLQGQQKHIRNIDAFSETFALASLIKIKFPMNLSKKVGWCKFIEWSRKKRTSQQHSVCNIYGISYIIIPSI